MLCLRRKGVGRLLVVVLLGGWALGLLGVFPVEVGAHSIGTPGPRVRYNITGGGQISKYVAGMKALQAFEDPTDADAVNEYAEFVALHAKNGQHGNPRFLPWHRQFLHDLEDAVRAMPGPAHDGFTVPYWNWFRVSSPPPGGLGGNGAGSDHWQVQNIFGEGMWKTTGGRTGHNVGGEGMVLHRQYTGSLGGLDDLAYRNTADTRLDNAPLGGAFEALLETYHGAPHVRVGGGAGQLGSLTLAVNDPLFFLLHSNTDRIWWQKQNSSPPGVVTLQPVGPIIAMSHVPGVPDCMPHSEDEVFEDFDGEGDVTPYDVPDDFEEMPLSNCEPLYGYDYHSILVGDVPVPDDYDVPEPSSLVLTGVGALFLGLYRRSRRGA